MGYAERNDMKLRFWAAKRFRNPIQCSFDLKCIPARRKIPPSEKEARYFEHRQSLVAINRVNYCVKMYKIILTMF